MQNLQSSFSINLKYWLKRRGLRQSDLAELIGVSPQMISNYINSVNVPRMPKIDEICKVLGINRIDLMSSPTDTTIIEQETEQIILITDINNNGIPDHLEGDDFFQRITIPKTFLNNSCDSKFLFIIQVHIPSAEKLLPPDRTYVIVRTNITIDCFKNGDFAVFRKDDNQYVIKKFYRKGNAIIMRPYIEHLDYIDYIDHKISVEEFNKRIKGKVIGHFVIDEE